MSRKIAIVGFGKEGVSCANYFGNTCQISIFDDKPKEQIAPLATSLKDKNVNFYLGGKFPKELKFDLVVRSPGVRPDHPLIQKLTKGGAIQTSATSIFFDQCPARIIGVTGTKGKGTTATLIYEMLKSEVRSVFLGGNIGVPALDILPKLTPKSLVVLELSSFQLYDLAKSPQIAMVLMITSEHLDWHKDTAEYQKAKESIVKFQKSDDFAVINLDFAGSRALAAKTRAKVYFVSCSAQTNGVFTKNGKVISRVDKQEEIIKTSQVLIPGKHNLQNVVAATAVAKILGIGTSNIRKVLETFRGLPHRLQFVREILGVKFYNDSASTIPETTIAAIYAFAADKILILGGSSKKSDFTNLASIIVEDKRVKALILIGQEAPRIRAAISRAGGFGGKIIYGVKNMPQIVKTAKNLANRGDIIILSPACASFDMFDNYQDRGEQFMREIKAIK